MCVLYIFSVLKGNGGPAEASISGSTAQGKLLGNSSVLALAIIFSTYLLLPRNLDKISIGTQLQFLKPNPSIILSLCSRSNFNVPTISPTEVIQLPGLLTIPTAIPVPDTNPHYQPSPHYDLTASI